MTGSNKQIKWALAIRKSRLVEWGNSALFKEIEAGILANNDSAWWIANKDRSLEKIYSEMKGADAARIEMQHWIRIDTKTGIQFISPIRNMSTGEIVVDESLPF